MTAGKEQLPHSCSVLIRPPASTLLKHYIQTAAKSYTTLPTELSKPVTTLSWFLFPALTHITEALADRKKKEKKKQTAGAPLPSI